jgi:hypothetical protein
MCTAKRDPVNATGFAYSTMTATGPIQRCQACGFTYKRARLIVREVDYPDQR